MKPFAILILADLSIRYFDDKDSFKTAIEVYVQKRKMIQAFRFDEGAAIYAPVEVKTLEFF